MEQQNQSMLASVFDQINPTTVKNRAVLKENIQKLNESMANINEVSGLFGDSKIEG